MSNPVFGYDNIFEQGTVSVSGGEATGHPKENGYDWRTTDSWQPTSVQTPSLNVDMGSARECDYFALAGHNIGDNAEAVTITVQSADDSGFTTNLTTHVNAVAVTDNKVMLISFTATSQRYWRFFMDMQTASPAEYPYIGHVAIGSRLDMPEGVEPSYTPPTLSFDDDVQNSQSKGGQFLGRSIKRQGASGRMRFSFLTPAWVRSTWEPFMQHHRLKPFFMSWDESTYPDEAAFCWTDRAAIPPVYPQSGQYMDVTIDYKALIE